MNFIDGWQFINIVNMKLVDLVVYRSVCATADCNPDYIGEFTRRLNDCIKYHSGWDRNSHMVKNMIECGHEPVSKDNFKHLQTFFGITQIKICEALMIRCFKPSLNIHEKSAKL